MVAISELKRLQQRKAILLAEAELCRSNFQAEVQAVRSRLGWIEQSAKFVRRSYPLLALGAPLAGLLFMRRRRRKRERAGTSSKWAMAWQLGQYALPLVQAFLSRKSRD